MILEEACEIFRTMSCGPRTHRDAPACGQHGEYLISFLVKMQVTGYKTPGGRAFKATRAPRSIECPKCTAHHSVQS